MPIKTGKTPRRGKGSRAKGGAPPKTEKAAPPKTKPAPAIAITKREREVLATLNKDNNSAPAQLLGSQALAIKIRGVISTQAPTVDRAIGRGGIPLGRIILLHGKEGSGKTTIALHLVAETQSRGGMVIYADAEYKLDPDYARRVGVDLNRLIIIQPDYLEKLFAGIENTLAVAKQYRVKGESFPILIVLDSINAMPTKAEFEGGWEDRHIAPDAGVYSSKLKKLTPMINREDVALLLISQEREKVGVMFGRKEQTGGGKAPRFYSSLIMEVARVGAIKDGDEVIGNLTEVRCAKNQIAPPFKKAQFNLIFGRGIDYEQSLLQMAVDAGIVEKKGAWYNYKGERIGQGEANAVAVLRGQPQWVDNIKEALK